MSIKMDRLRTELASLSQTERTELLKRELAALPRGDRVRLTHYLLSLSQPHPNAPSRELTQESTDWPDPNDTVQRGGSPSSGAETSRKEDWSDQPHSASAFTRRVAANRPSLLKSERRDLLKRTCCSPWSSFLQGVGSALEIAAPSMFKPRLSAHQALQTDWSKIEGDLKRAILARHEADRTRPATATRETSGP